jgi:sarcosine oxidase subunit alpha
VSQPHRLQTGGDIDRSRTLPFTFNGRRNEGHPGDTLASALLANGVHLVARSFKYHRPRGIMTAGVEEPNAMVQVGEGGRTVPNVKATELALYDGLVAKSVNVFPSLQFDAGAAIGALSRFMPAGFYYKTFFGSRFLWQRVFEPVIRHAGGWGKAPIEPDPDTYDRTWHHCDILIVGAGPSGLMAALTAATTGARVTLIDENAPTGDHPVGAAPGREREKDSLSHWISEAKRELTQNESLTYLPRTTVFGYYDNNSLTAIQKLSEPAENTVRIRERLWHLRAKHVILATGAHERPLVFANNDRPGIMLAGAVSTYINRYAVLPGRRAVLFTNNDHAYKLRPARRIRRLEPGRTPAQPIARQTRLRRYPRLLPPDRKQRPCRSPYHGRSTTDFKNFHRRQQRHVRFEKLPDGSPNRRPRRSKSLRFQPRRPDQLTGNKRSTPNTPIPPLAGPVTHRHP